MGRGNGGLLGAKKVVSSSSASGFWSTSDVQREDGANNWPTLGDFESIGTIIISSDTASVTFSSIPQTYKHLQVRILGRGTRVSPSDYCNFQFNGDTASNYQEHQLYGTGSTPVSGSDNIQTYINTMNIGGSSLAANTFGVGIMDILDYTNTNKYKTTRMLTGWDNNTANGVISFESGHWRSTNAITSIRFFPLGANFVQYSHFALYGIKG
jgi:hypothetical protein